MTRSERDAEMSARSDGLDKFERWAGRVAWFLIVAAPLQFAATVILFQEHRRIAPVIYTATSFFMGLVVKYALHVFKTNQAFAIRLIERSFYAMLIATVVVIFDDFYSDGISDRVVGYMVFIGIYIFIGIKIFEIKHRASMSSQSLR
jgi:hypothetical protein